MLGSSIGGKNKCGSESISWPKDTKSAIKIIYTLVKKSAKDKSREDRILFVRFSELGSLENLGNSWRLLGFLVKFLENLATSNGTNAVQVRVEFGCV